MKLTSPLPKRRLRIVVIPLIDIMFFLLAAFMMVSLQLARTQNSSVVLPQMTQGQPLFDTSGINVVVDKEGQVWLEKERVSLRDFAARFGEHRDRHAGAQVYVSGDRDTLVEAMSPVLQIVKRAGVEKVCFVVGGTTNGMSL